MADEDLCDKITKFIGKIELNKAEYLESLEILDKADYIAIPYYDKYMEDLSHIMDYMNKIELILVDLHKDLKCPKNIPSIIETALSGEKKEEREEEEIH
ncbi:MAG: hypothetical protein QXG92_03300 [Thermoplasmata archaeon]